MKDPRPLADKNILEVALKQYAAFLRAKDQSPIIKTTLKRTLEMITEVKSINK